MGRGTASPRTYDTMGRVFGMLDAQAVESSFRKWVSGQIPALDPYHVLGKLPEPKLTHDFY